MKITFRYPFGRVREKISVSLGRVRVLLFDTLLITQFSSEFERSSFTVHLSSKESSRLNVTQVTMYCNLSTRKSLQLASPPPQVSKAQLFMFQHCLPIHDNPISYRYQDRDKSPQFFLAHTGYYIRSKLLLINP